MGAMALLPSRLVLSLDAGSVSAAAAAWGWGGLRLRSFGQVSFATGVLAPSPFEPNLLQPETVRAALTELRERLGATERRATVILPDGVARIVLMETRGGVAPRDLARYRLAQGLPFPVEEAVVDVLPVGPGRILAAAVRRRVVEEYETAVAAAGWTRERVDLAPLAALAALRRMPGGATVDVILGDAALSLAAFRHGQLRVFRSRRRDPGPGEAGRLREEVDRSAALAGAEARPRVRVVGPGTLALIRELSALGREAEPGWGTPQPGLPGSTAELAWIGAAAS